MDYLSIYTKELVKTMFLHIFLDQGLLLWPRSCALKIGRREVPGTILNYTYQPSSSELSVLFSETRVNIS